MNNALTWKRAFGTSDSWWLTEPLGPKGWSGVVLVSRPREHSPWTVSVPHLVSSGATEVRDTQCTSLHAACAQAEEWAEGRGYRIEEKFSEGGVV